MNQRRDQIRVHIEGKEYSVVGGDFQSMLAAVKQINGRRFNGQLKVWQLPGAAPQIQNQLEASGFQLEGGAPAEIPAPVAGGAPARPGGDRIKLTVQGRQISVVGGDFQSMLAAVKNLPGRRFDGDSRSWEVPGEPAIIKQLVEAAGFQLEGADDLLNAPVPAMEVPDFSAAEQPLPFEEPDFLWEESEVPDYEPPDWWDDDNAPPPPVSPPAWLEDEPLFPPDEPHFPSDGPPMPASPPPANSPRASAGGDQIRVRVGGIPFVVSGGNFQAMLAVIKNLPGRRFDGQDKVWDVPAGIEAVQQLIEAAGLQLSRD